MKPLRFLAQLLALPVVVLQAQADEVSVAIAANFTGPMEKIAPAFEKATGHKALVAYSIGKQVIRTYGYEF